MSDGLKNGTTESKSFLLFPNDPYAEGYWSYPYEKTLKKKADFVNYPPHYTKGEIECIDAMRASCTSEAFRGYLKLCVIKYLWRYESKDNPLQDLQKAQWYLNKLEGELKSKSEKQIRKEEMAKEWMERGEAPAEDCGHPSIDLVPISEGVVFCVRCGINVLY